MNRETERPQEQTMEEEKNRAETARRVFWLVFAVMVLMLLTSGIAYLVDKK